MPEEHGSITIKDAVVLVPIIGAALAFVFDAGYFVGVGPGFFTMFSLSEHIVFALAFLPYGLLLSALMIGYGRPFRRERTFDLLFRTNGGMFVIISLAVIAWIVVFLVKKGDVPWRPSMIGALSAVPLIILTLRVARRRVEYTDVLFFGTLAVAVAAFGSGYAFAPSKTSRGPEHLIVSTQGEIRGRVLRSGDKFLLFIDEGGKTTIIQWKDISRITAD